MVLSGITTRRGAKLVDLLVASADPLTLERVLARFWRHVSHRHLPIDCRRPVTGGAVMKRRCSSAQVR